MTVAPHPPYFTLFLKLNIKLKGSHFDTTEVIETEWQAVLNTLTEYNFQMHLKGGSTGNISYEARPQRKFPTRPNASKPYIARSDCAYVIEQ
jgi:hypothetical protein